MTKAQEAALKAFPGESLIHDRTVFRFGYEQAEENLGWISVKERLPENADYVLTCVDVNGVPQCIGLGYYSNDAGMWIDPSDEEDGADNVDYWMPIPELPKEK